MSVLLRAVPEVFKASVASGNVKVYGSILKDVASGKIVGHLEAVKLPKIIGGVFSGAAKGALSGAATGNPVMAGISAATGAIQSVSGIVGNVQNQKMISQLTQMGMQLTQISTKLSTVATLGWVNVGMSAVSLGVTAVGMVVLTKKLNHIQSDINAISNKLDSMDMKLTAIQLGVDRLNENAIRECRRTSNKLIMDMMIQIESLNSSINISDDLSRESMHLLAESSAFLNDMIERYIENFEIVITMEQLMSFFTVYNSFVNVLMTRVYISTQKVIDPTSYQAPMRKLCSESVIKALQEQTSRAATSLLTQSELNAISTAYKYTISEQVKMLKSNEQIIDTLPYGELKTIDEELRQNQQEFDSFAFVQY